MIIHPLTEENINHVMSNLWPRGKAEVEKWGFTVEEYQELFIDMIGKPWALAFYDNNGCPCSLCFMRPIGEKRWRTYFAATEDGFKRIWKPLTIFLSRLSDSLVKDGGYMECLSGNDGARAWFECMGFKLIEKMESINKYTKGV